MPIGVFAAVTKFERRLLIERTRAGLAWAKAEGKARGCPASISAAQVTEVQRRLKAGEVIAAAARPLGTSRQPVMRTSDASGPK
jgi:putative DNA-invertase from lambdoid prophage Rac